MVDPDRYVAESHRTKPERSQIMGEFFHGWRRNTGCVTLAVACLFLAGWVRSSIIADVADFGVMGRNSIDVLSVNHMIGVVFIRNDLSCNPSWIPRWTNNLAYITLLLDDSGYTWRHRILGNYAAGYPTVRMLMGPRYVFVVHYATIVFPLTLLSAWLLLSKPRTRADVST